MIAHEVAKKYAHALLMVVKEKNLIDRADEQMTGLRELIRRDRSLINFLTAPQILEEKKYELVRKVFSERLERVLIEFLVVLIDKHRVRFLPDILDEFDRLVNAEKGLLRATVISALQLDQSVYDSLKPKLEKKTGLKVEIEKKIDPSILGGMIVVMHDEIIDGSVRHSLDLIREKLERVKVA
ncbi:MAG: ATP synthase F1 subunit delta [candidate division Zixibacteria bacterium]|nr:ATP synthase F1 subunit delta [candidate division Zixibacteria bacterium]